MARRIHMGTLARPHGIKGEICVDWYADSPSLLDGPFWLQAGDAPPRPARARSWRMHKGRPLLLLEGVTDRNDIEALRGQKILVDRDLLPPVDEDEVYVEDVLGFAVILPDGSRLGVLDHVEYPAGLEVWSIVTDDGKEVLFPAEASFIEGFDLEGECIHIAPPEGLLDIYLGGDEQAPDCGGHFGPSIRLPCSLFLPVFFAARAVRNTGCLFPGRMVPAPAGLDLPSAGLFV